MNRLRALDLLALICVALAHASSALEADCAACDFCRSKKDLAEELTTRIQAHIAAGKSARDIAEFEGGGSIIRSHIEVWANQHPEATKPIRKRLKYRGSNLPDNTLFSSYARCVKVGGVCIGTDKLGHLFQQGWEFYQISVLDGKGDAVAERYGEWLEGKGSRESYSADEDYFRRQSSGRLVGYGGFGRTISGVISNADLAAGKAGLQMYKDITGRRFKTIADYVTDSLCEEKNFNDYTPEMRRIVEKNDRR
jgi:hypothetical protein